MRCQIVNLCWYCIAVQDIFYWFNSSFHSFNDISYKRHVLFYCSCFNKQIRVESIWLNAVIVSLHSTYHLSPKIKSKCNVKISLTFKYYLIFRSVFHIVNDYYNREKLRDWRSTTKMWSPCWIDKNC